MKSKKATQLSSKLIQSGKNKIFNKKKNKKRPSQQRSQGKVCQICNLVYQIEINQEKENKKNDKPNFPTNSM